jgi:hypothetical protein
MRPISFMAAAAAALLSNTILGAVPCGSPCWAGLAPIRDGQVTQQEYERFRAMGWPRRTARSDPLGNANPPPQFLLLDRDGDGDISTEEMAVRRAIHPPGIRQQCAKRHVAGFSGPRPDCPNRAIPPGLVSTPVQKNCPNRLVPAGLVH